MFKDEENEQEDNQEETKETSENIDEEKTMQITPCLFGKERSNLLYP